VVVLLSKETTTPIKENLLNLNHLQKSHQEELRNAKQANNHYHQNLNPHPKSINSLVTASKKKTQTRVVIYALPPST